MKNKIVTLVAAFALAASLAACQQSSTAKVAVLDPNKVFTTCDACRQGGDYLRSLGQGLQKELTEMQATMKDQKGDDVAAKFQARFQEIQQKMVGEQTRIAGKLDEAFQKVMDDYRAKNGVAVIMNKENVLSFDQTSDVTEAVIAALNSAKIDLEIPAEALKKADEAAPAPTTEATTEEKTEEKKAE